MYGLIEMMIATAETVAEMTAEMTAGNVVAEMLGVVVTMARYLMLLIPAAYWLAFCSLMLPSYVSIVIVDHVKNSG